MRPRRCITRNGTLAHDVGSLHETLRVERDGVALLIETREVHVGDIVLVHPGEKIPVDAHVEAGESRIDEAMLTGESRPVSKRAGDPVFAGTINQHCALRLIAEAVGDATALAGIIRLVREAQATRAPIQSTVDRVAGVLVPSMILLAVAVGRWWSASGAEPAAALAGPVGVWAGPLLVTLATGTLAAAARGMRFAPARSTSRASSHR